MIKTIYDLHPHTPSTSPYKKKSYAIAIAKIALLTLAFPITLLVCATPLRWRVKAWVLKDLLCDGCYDILEKFHAENFSKNDTNNRITKKKFYSLFRIAPQLIHSICKHFKLYNSEGKIRLYEDIIYILSKEHCKILLRRYNKCFDPYNDCNIESIIYIMDTLKVLINPLSNNNPFQSRTKMKF